jgi:hypothetical protein
MAAFRRRGDRVVAVTATLGELDERPGGLATSPLAPVRSAEPGNTLRRSVSSSCAPWASR